MAFETTRRCRTVVMSVILILAASSNTSAQETDARWHPWLGCWQLWEEQLDPSAPTTNDETAALLNRTYVCVRPGSTPDRVDLTAVAGEQILVERTLVADASRRDVQETGCTGWEQSEWSFDGRRLFTRAELQCGDEERRTVTGVSLLSSSSIWVDIFHCVKVRPRGFSDSLGTTRRPNSRKVRWSKWAPQSTPFPGIGDGRGLMVVSAWTIVRLRSQRVNNQESEGGGSALVLRSGFFVPCVRRGSSDGQCR